MIWVGNDGFIQKWNRLTPRVFPNGMLREGDIITKVNDAARPVMEALKDYSIERLLVVCRLGD